MRLESDFIYQGQQNSLINKRISNQDNLPKSLPKQKSKINMKQNHSQTFKQNISKLQEYLQELKDPKFYDFSQFLTKNYDEESKIINIGSIYQIPTGPKGVDILMRFCFWQIQMLNLTSHKIQNEGLQNLINYGKQHPQQLKKLKMLSIIRNNITSEGFQGIQKINLSSLKKLMAANNSIDHRAIYKIIKAQWPEFQELDLSNNNIGKQGCRLLMKSNWKKLRKLDLNYNMIGNQGLHYLSEADWPQLVELNISNNKIDATGTFYMKKANWPLLKSIMLNRNQIGMQNGKFTNTGCVNLCQLKTKYIKKFSLYGNQITLNGILMLLNSQKLAPGCFMELSRNNFKFEDIKETLQSLDRFCNQFQN